LDQGTLNQLVSLRIALYFESSLSLRTAKPQQVRPAWRRGRSAGGHPADALNSLRNGFIRSAVAIGALNFNRSAHFAIQLGIAVIVLQKMAIDAVHSFFEVDVHEMHRRVVALLALLHFLL